MPTVADAPREELEQTLAIEIARARQNALPVSRHTLTRLLQATYTIHPSEAERFVDQYCDEKAAGVPTYLSAEFGVPYLKILGSIQLAVGIGLYVFPIAFPRADLTFWPAMLLGTLFAGSGLFCIYQSLRPAKEKSTVRVSEGLAMMGDSAESEATGSLPPRS